MKSNQN